MVFRQAQECGGKTVVVGGDELGVGSLISRRIQDGLQNPTKGSSVIICPGVHPGKLECWKGDEPVTGRERLVAGEKDKGRCIRGGPVVWV